MRPGQQPINNSCPNCQYRTTERWPVWDGVNRNTEPIPEGALEPDRRNYDDPYRNMMMFRMMMYDYPDNVDNPIHRRMARTMMHERPHDADMLLHHMHEDMFTMWQEQSVCERGTASEGVQTTRVRQVSVAGIAQENGVTTGVVQNAAE